MDRVFGDSVTAHHIQELKRAVLIKLYLCSNVSAIAALLLSYIIRTWVGTTHLVHPVYFTSRGTEEQSHILTIPNLPS
jgi:hypothetical protein